MGVDQDRSGGLEGKEEAAAEEHKHLVEVVVLHKHLDEVAVLPGHFDQSWSTHCFCSLQ